MFYDIVINFKLGISFCEINQHNFSSKKNAFGFVFHNFYRYKTRATPGCETMSETINETQDNNRYKLIGNNRKTLQYLRNLWNV